MFRPVFLTEEEVTLIRSRIRQEEWASSIARQVLLDPALLAAKRPLQIPAPFFAGQAFFNDPETGAPLNFDPDSRGRYKTADGRWIESPALDWGWDAISHDQNANAMRKCALAGMLYEDAGLLGKAKEILFAYSTTYPARPPRGRQSATWGKLYYQALNESVWAISALWTAECLWLAHALSTSELEKVRDDLFFPLADLVWGEWYFIHNIRMWHNAAIGMIGLAFQDRNLIRHAIFGDKGFRQQLVDGYRWQDAFSCEGTVGYHGYGLTAMLFLAEAMARNGFDPYHDPHFRRALAAPFALVQPDGTPPTLGDMFHAKAIPTRLYATTLGRYPDDALLTQASALAFAQWKESGFQPDFESSSWNNTTGYFGRSEVDWILHGPPPDSNQSGGESLVVFQDTGMAVSRPEPGSYLLLKAFGQTGAHDHYDRLGIIWWEQGVCWFEDPGTCYYSHPNHEGWFKHTVSHNTACVDERAQERGTARLLGAEAGVLEGEARPYPESAPQIRFYRKLERIAHGWKDEFKIEGETRQAALFFHPRGNLKNQTDGFEPCRLRIAKANPNLPANAKGILLSRFSEPVRIEKSGYVLILRFVDYPEDTQLIIGEAPANPQQQKDHQPMLALLTGTSDPTFITEFTIETQPTTK
jgi:hypothetical protein